MYQLFCDSNCELWFETAKALSLKVISMPYSIGDDVYYYDLGEKTDFKAFYDRMRAGETPKTQALNDLDYIDYFEPVLQEGKDIYYITFSHKLSGTFESMKRAIKTLKEKYPEREIRYFDTKRISVAAGIIVYYAALEWQKGISMDEMDEFLKELAPRQKTVFAVDDLVYLKRGGRISSFAAAAGTILNLKPILTIMPDGTLQSIEKVKGSKKATAYLVNYWKDDVAKMAKNKIYVLHADCEDRADELIAKLREAYPEYELDIVKQMIGPVIGTHAGPGALAICAIC